MMRFRIDWAVVVLLVMSWSGAASAQDGACCLGSGVCVSTSDVNCSSLGGEFFGAGTTCSGVVCGGACCLPNGTCTLGSANDCATGTFQGAGSTCATHCGGPAGAAFTYQGELRQDGEPVSGTVEIEAWLWTTALGGDPVGNVIVLRNVSVTNGRFTVPLDFGVGAFTGEQRWLELAVDGTLLAPRQLITRTPYATQTRGMVVDNSERVGIGTSFPETKLHVLGFGTSPVLRVSGGGDSNTAMLVDDVAGIGRAALFEGVTSNDLLSVGNLGTGNAASFRGLVQMANEGDASGSTLHVVSTAGFHAIEAIAQNDPAVNAAGRFINFGASQGTEYGVQASALGPGGTGILATGGRAGITANASGATGAGVEAGTLSTTGVNYAVYGVCASPQGFDFFAAGAGVNYGAASSQRWKRDVEPIPNALATIAQLRGVFFTWDEAHGGQHDIGMIAEEVGDIFPEVVQYEENGVDAIGMDYSKLTPLLVEAVNALRAEKNAEIDALRAEKDAEISQLMKRLAALEERVARTQ